MFSANHLINEKSPYLLQHAHNPVNWHSWSEETLSKASRENKLLLVSIGYATCHWCHVMERESFKDEDVASLLNEYFIPIKVDREERPDVDAVYMRAAYILGQQGGWPLNAFCTPDAEPFYIGTYFPPRDRYHLPSFKRVLLSINQMWQKKSQNIVEQAQSLLSVLNKQKIHLDNEIPNFSIAKKNYCSILKQSFDKQDGGFIFQSKNKFPPSMHISALLHLQVFCQTEEKTDILQIVKQTLTAMRWGGIYDQVGGGLSRYATDYKWLVPHFEKMLYDNALFSIGLLETYQVTGEKVYLEYAEDVLTYLVRDLKHSDGGFYCAEDADSEGEEGKFYVWEWEELERILSPSEFLLVQEYFGVTQAGNFEGRNILTIIATKKALAKKLQMNSEKIDKQIKSLRQTLLKHRSKRVRPLLDDKILTSWNALAIQALIKMASITNSNKFLTHATRSAEFIIKRLFSFNEQEGHQLLRRYRDGEAKYPAYLIDYATLARAYIDLYEVTFQVKWLNHAKQLADLVQNYFFLSTEGGFCETDSRSEKLIARTVDAYDGVEPSGNSNAVWVFLKLGYYFNEDSYLKQAENILKVFSEELCKTISSPIMLSALAVYENGFLEITLLGDVPSTWIKEIRRHYLPHLVIAKIPLRKENNTIPLLLEKIKEWGKVKKPSVIICQRRTCSPPLYSLSELKKYFNHILI